MEGLDFEKNKAQRCYKCKYEEKESNSPCRMKFKKMVKSLYWEWFIMIIIILNSIVLASNHYGEEPTRIYKREIINVFFSGTYTVEAVLMIIGLGFR